MQEREIGRRWSQPELPFEDVHLSHFYNKRTGKKWTYDGVARYGYGADGYYAVRNSLVDSLQKAGLGSVKLLPLNDVKAIPLLKVAYPPNAWDETGNSTKPILFVHDRDGVLKRESKPDETYFVLTKGAPPSPIPETLTLEYFQDPFTLATWPYTKLRKIDNSETFNKDIEESVRKVFPDATFPTPPNEDVFLVHGTFPDTAWDASRRLTTPIKFLHTLPTSLPNGKNPHIVFKKWDSPTGSVPTPAPAPTPVPAPAPTPTPTPHVTSECGPPAAAIPPPPPPSAKLLPVFPDVTKDRVRDTFEELQKKYPSMPYLQPPSEVNLGGGYCAAWSLWIQSKLIKLSAEEYWNLPYQARQDVYARVIYGLNPTTSKFTPFGTLQMKTDLEQTIVPGKRVLAPRTKKNATTGQAETLTPGRLTNNPTGSVPMLYNFAEKVMRPATQNPDAPFRWISGAGGYHIVEKRADLFGDFVKLNNTTPDPKPILFNVTVKTYNGGYHALCFVYFPKSHEIDIVSTYTISPQMSKYDALEAMYESNTYVDGKPNYRVLNTIEKQLHLPITPRPGGRRRTFRKRASKRKTRRRRTIRR